MRTIPVKFDQILFIGLERDAFWRNYCKIFIGCHGNHSKK